MRSNLKRAFIQKLREPGSLFLRPGMCCAIRWFGVMKISITYILFPIICHQAYAQADSIKVKKITINDHITLSYIEKGAGEALIFVHGSLADYSYWTRQVNFFSPYFKTISYSRRYDFPNQNKAQPDYSALTDADDLAAF